MASSSGYSSVFRDVQPQRDCGEWIEKFSKKYAKSFWKNNTTGEKVWHPPHIPPKKSTNVLEQTSSPIVVNDRNSEIREPVYSSINRRKLGNNEAGLTRTNDQDANTIHTPMRKISTKPKSSRRDESELEDPQFTRSPNLVARRVDVADNVDAMDHLNWEARISRKHNRPYWRNKASHETTWRDPYAASDHRSASPNREMSHEQELNSPPTSVKKNATSVESFPALDASQTENSNQSTSQAAKPVPPPKPADKYPRRENHCKRQSARVELLNRTRAQAALAEDTDASTDASGDAGGDNRQNVSADGRWEMRYSRKSGKKYWRDIVSGETTWRLSAIAVQRGDHSPSVTPGKPPAKPPRQKTESHLAAHATNKVCSSPPPPLLTFEGQVPSLPTGNVQLTPSIPLLGQPRTAAGTHSPLISTDGMTSHAVQDGRVERPQGEGNQKTPTPNSPNAPPHNDGVAITPTSAQSSDVSVPSTLVTVSLSELKLTSLSEETDAIELNIITEREMHDCIDLDLPMPWEDLCERLSYTNPLWDIMLRPNMHRSTGRTLTSNADYMHRILHL